MTEKIVELCQALAKNSRKLIKLIERYDNLRENIVDNAYLLEKKQQEIAKVIELVPAGEVRDSLGTWLNAQKNDLTKAKEDFRFNFGQELKMLSHNDGKELRGQYPLLRIGFFTLKLDFEFGEAALYFGPEIEKLKSKMTLQPKLIWETIARYDNELRDFKFSVEETFSDLARAYKNRLALTNKSMGEKLLITEVMHEYVSLKQSKQFIIDPRRENFREYPRVKLSYLLFRLKNSDLYQRGLRLHVATFDATTNKLHSIWVPDNEEGDGTYYSYISFEKVQNT